MEDVNHKFQFVQQCSVPVVAQMVFANLVQLVLFSVHLVKYVLMVDVKIQIVRAMQYYVLQIKDVKMEDVSL